MEPESDTMPVLKSWVPIPNYKKPSGSRMANLVDEVRGCPSAVEDRSPGTAASLLASKVELSLLNYGHYLRPSISPGGEIGRRKGLIQFEHSGRKLLM